MHGRLGILNPYSMVAIGLMSSGCDQLVIPVPNCGELPVPNVTPLTSTANARLGLEEGREDVLWLEIEKDGGDSVVGGYLSHSDDHHGGLIIMLPGAATTQSGGRREAALSLYDDYGFRFVHEGFRVWSLALLEDTPYGADEVDDLLAALDWLKEEGESLLDTERIYVVGYSTGAITANVVNLQRNVTAMASLGSLTQPDQILSCPGFYRAVTSIFPCNTGMAQMLMTLNEYSREQWKVLDIVSRVDELRNPTLFMHVADDIIFAQSNTRAVEEVYNAMLEEGRTDLAELSFYYAPRGGHFCYVLDPDFFPPLLEYLNTFEP